MTLADAPGWLIDLGAVSGALLAVGALIAGVWRLLHRWTRWLLGGLGERVEQHVSPVMAELRTNHGTSLRDAVDRIERRGVGTEGEVAGLKVVVGALERRTERIESKLYQEDDP